MADAKGLIVQEIVKSGHTRFLHFPYGATAQVDDGVLVILDGNGWTLGVFAAGQWVNVLQGNSVYWKSGDNTGGPIELVEGGEG